VVENDQYLRIGLFAEDLGLQVALVDADHQGDADILDQDTLR
jgi:hypothetical protein